MEGAVLKGFLVLEFSSLRDSVDNDLNLILRQHDQIWIALDVHEQVVS